MSPEVREMHEEGLRMAGEKKNTLIKALKDTGRCKFGDEELQQLSMKELGRLAELAGVDQEPRSFSFLGANTAAPQSSGIPKPVGLVATLQANKQRVN